MIHSFSISVWYETQRLTWKTFVVHIEFIVFCLCLQPCSLMAATSGRLCTWLVKYEVLANNSTSKSDGFS